MLKRIRRASLSQEGTTGSDRNSRQNSVTSPRELKTAPPSIQPTTPKPLLASTGRGPSFMGLLAAKRFTRKLTNKYGRSNSMYGSSKYSNNTPTIQREPTYRLEPKRRFNPERVQKIVKEVVDQRMKDFKYHPKFCSNMCKILSDEIKDRVKNQRYDRYKIIAVVHIGERKNQSMLVCSRGAWDDKLDDYASYSMETPSLFCTASVYGIYTE